MAHRGPASLSTALAGDGRSGKEPVVVMETSLGTIKIELYAEKAPLTVKNFLSYVDDKFYDGTIFHRVISDFMIQGGGFEPGMKEKKTKAPIKNESGNGLSNDARHHRHGPHQRPRQRHRRSSTSTSWTTLLDRLDQTAGYCVFGKVIEGMDVVDKIKAVKTGRKGPYDDVPVKDVVIESVRRADK